VVDISIFIATGDKDLPEDKPTTFIRRRFGVGTEDSLRKGQSSSSFGSGVGLVENGRTGKLVKESRETHYRHRRGILGI
jgi:hypothetical protein